MAKGPRIYWDSCAWLGLLNGEADKKRALEIIYGNARRDLCELWTSTITILEVRRFQDEQNDPKPLSAEKLEKLRNLFRQPFIKPIPLALDIAERGREIVRTTAGLKKWQDAVHLASALRWNATVLHTYDNDDLTHLTKKFTCRNGEPLPICYPDETADGPLFAKTA